MQELIIGTQHKIDDIIADAKLKRSHALYAMNRHPECNALKDDYKRCNLLLAALNHIADKWDEQ